MSALIIRAFLLLCITVSFYLAGCSTKYQSPACDQLDPELYVEASDPFEPVNRGIYRFNDSIDKAMFERTARMYRKVTPDTIERGVTNFFNNLKEPRNIASSLFLGKPEATAQSTLRFVLNSTVGLGGVIDVAGYSGLPYKNYTLGQAFGYWGIPSGPYLVLPFLGSSSVRDGLGDLVTHQHTYIIKNIQKSEHQLFVQQMSFIDARARLLTFTDLLEEQPDPYLFVRESYHQTSLNAACNP